MSAPRILAVIPARGGSLGLPGKNIRPFAGLPLLVHSLKLAGLCPEITRCIVTTDSEEIARTAREYGGDVPFLRPAELAKSETAMWPVLKHALSAVEAQEGKAYDFLLLLDPTSPTRTPQDVTDSLARLTAAPQADGVVAVSEPEFNPVWHSVVDDHGRMKDLLEGSRFNSRQEAPVIYRINGLLYLWRAAFVRTAPSWRDVGYHLMLVVPDSRAVSIDTLEQFERTEALLRTGFIKLPWLETDR